MTFLVHIIWVLPHSDMEFRIIFNKFAKLIFALKFDIFRLNNLRQCIPYYDYLEAITTILKDLREAEFNLCKYIASKYTR